jgi:hypothetical protein
VTSALDRVDTLEPGRGRLDLGVLLRGGDDNGVLGAFADYQHRLTERWSAFGTARGGIAWSEGHAERFYEGLLGARWTF